LAAWPAGAFLVGLSSIYWREAWKYGERAFRYCQHDLGHALAALRMSAAALGWRMILLDTVPSGVIGSLLGLDRDQDFLNAEREEAELLALVAPNAACLLRSQWDGAGAAELAESWFGQANLLSSRHVVDWTLIENVARATSGAPASRVPDDFEDFPTDEELRPASVHYETPSAAAVILGRRSATAMDGTSISRTTFLHLLSRLIPTQDSLAPPWDTIPWRPRIHLGLFVHRVDGLSAGLYALPREPERALELKTAMRRDFLWEKVSECPVKLPLYLLERGDFGQMASAVSCGQVIAGDGAFSLAMIAEFRGSLAQFGSRFYRRLFWEAGMIGQILYLEAYASGLGATGLGCYFDDPVHEQFGLMSTEWQSLYHFTVGRAEPDKRIVTLPAYNREPTAR
jgi:nitroreductase